jgi:hypothetical protein
LGIRSSLSELLDHTCGLHCFALPCPALPDQAQGLILLSQHLMAVVVHSCSKLSSSGAVIPVGGRASGTIPAHLQAHVLSGKASRDRGAGGTSMAFGGRVVAPHPEVTAAAAAALTHDGGEWLLRSLRGVLAFESAFMQHRAFAARHACSLGGTQAVATGALQPCGAASCDLHAGQLAGRTALMATPLGPPPHPAQRRGGSSTAVAEARASGNGMPCSVRSVLGCETGGLLLSPVPPGVAAGAAAAQASLQLLSAWRPSHILPWPEVLQLATVPSLGEDVCRTVTEPWEGWQSKGLPLHAVAINSVLPSLISPSVGRRQQAVEMGGVDLLQPLLTAGQACDILGSVAQLGNVQSLWPVCEACLRRVLAAWADEGLADALEREKGYSPTNRRAPVATQPLQSRWTPDASAAGMEEKAAAGWPPNQGAAPFWSPQDIATIRCCIVVHDSASTTLVCPFHAFMHMHKPCNTANTLTLYQHTLSNCQT